MFIPSTFKRPVSSWKALNLRKTLLMASSVRLKPLNCSRLPCVYAQETLTFLLTQKKTDTLTLADDRLEAFHDNPNALRDYFRDIGRMVLAAEGRKANDSHADCYQYFCVPEYGTANGRLHFHAVHFMRTLPTGSVDPNFGRRVRNRRQLNSLQNTWPYGYSMPIAVRYTQDAFSRSGWLWP